MTELIKKSKFIVLFIFIISPYALFAQQGTVIINQDEEIEALLDLKKDVEASSDRYKIQIFNGGSRSIAEKTKGEFSKNHPDIESSLEYEEPNFKIWVGNFRSRLEADRALLRIKKTFANAFIFKPKKDY